MVDQCSTCIFSRPIGVGTQLYCRVSAPGPGVSFVPNGYPGSPVANDYWCGEGISSVDNHNFSQLMVGIMWNTYIPTLTPDAGAFTAATATGKYWQAGKTVAFYGKVEVTTNGTASGNLNFTLPIAPLTDQACQVGFGVVSITGSILVAGAKVTFPGTGEDGNVYYLNGMYEAA